MNLKLIFVLTLLFSGWKGFSYGQSSNFSLDSASWRQQFFIVGGCYFPNSDADYQTIYIGDTLINAISYKKVFNTGVSNCYPAVFGYQGALRFDSTLNQVYFVGKDSSSELLMYDFRMQIGDTIRGYFNFGLGNYVISSLDTITAYGIQRKRWGFNSFNNLPFTLNSLGFTAFSITRPIPTYPWFFK